jgi:hypothetical protein
MSKFTRRDFLKTSAGVAAGATLGAGTGLITGCAADVTFAGKWREASYCAGSVSRPG